MTNDKSKKIRIGTPNGRPMLKWVNKKPLDFVVGYPTELTESFGSKKPFKVPEYSQLEKDWHNLLFHGDNKEVLASLLELGFRGKVDLIYIDPPFASNKDYLRKVELRGLKELGQIEEENESIIQQTMYEDIWKRDEYFQFMYERLILLKELLADTGSLFLHVDQHKGHYLKVMLDELFGEDNFVNEIVWYYPDNFQGNVKGLANNHNTIYWYGKSKNYVANQVLIPLEKITKRDRRIWSKEKQALIPARNEDGKIIYDEYSHKKADDVWTIGQSSVTKTKSSEYRGYITQKPQQLLERIIKAASNEKGLILDCFVGSGTTCIAAQNLGRRWIGVDVNKAAIQTTAKAVQKLIKEQEKQFFSERINTAFNIYKVNNYDLKILKTEAKELAIQQYGIIRTKTETFFDGLRDSDELVKIIDFNHPLTLLDLQLIIDELNKRPDEDRDIVLISLGRETKVDSWIEEWNKKQPYKDARIGRRIRQFVIFDLKDKSFISYEPSKAEVEIARAGKDKVKIKVVSFISPSIIKRLELEPGLLQKKIPDFRSMIDVVLVDTNYDSEVFKIGFSDIPQKQSDLVKGEYELEITEKPTKVAVKIIDMLGEEVLITEEV